MARPPVTANLTRQRPIPEDGVMAALALLRSGRLHRYNVVGGDVSARMNNLRAAILRPQLRAINTSIAEWNARHDLIAGIPDTCPTIQVPVRFEAEACVGSSVQFFIDGLDSTAAASFVAAMAQVGTMDLT